MIVLFSLSLSMADRIIHNFTRLRVGSARGRSSRLGRNKNVFNMQLQNKKNELRIGLKADKKLKNSFYHFIYEKHIDWAIILSVFLLLLPCIASKNWYFLLLKTFIFLIISYQIGKYLLTWHSLHEYSKVQSKLEGQLERLIDSDKVAEGGEVLNKLSAEIQSLPNKAEKKKHMYKDFMEYLKYDKIDFIPIEDILNKDKEVTKRL